jgi:threonylcarbamoyladenosine tRNA methylthiotransferase MtaB
VSSCLCGEVRGKKMKLATITFGCKVNQYETACIADEFSKNGYSIVKYDEEADVYIINSCTVTNRTDFKSRSALRKALKRKEENPKVQVVITGCYSQRNKEEIEKLGDIDLIADNNSKSEIYKLLNHPETSQFDDILHYSDFEEMSTSAMNDRTRAFIKIQDGCDYYCTYCAIPTARGHSRSRDKDKIISQIQELVENGYKEFVLGGINLGLYGKDKNEEYFLSHLLLDLEEIEGLELLRLSSIEPQLFTEDLLEYFAESKKIAPHFHIPLQSGSNDILKKMKRKYSTEEFRISVENIRQIFPNAAFGFDVITGFPGETAELFTETYDFLESIDFTYLHVFSYSKRKGTIAAELKDQISGDVIKRRTNILVELSKRKLEEYTDKILLQKVQLSGVIEKKTEKYSTALSDRFIRVYFESNSGIVGEYLKFKPIRMFKDGLEVKIDNPSVIRSGNVIPAKAGI